ncbi:MAG: insulinase family protein [Deltaproteobacteria bacterium]|nr:insulinase family protein [Deltaproteobacteria bacterium]
MRALPASRWRSVVILSMLTAASAADARDFAAVAEEVGRAVPAAAPVKLVDSIRYGRDKDVAKFRLANGLTVIVLEDHAAPVVSYQTWFAVGSRFEMKGLTGIAHLFEHLMFKGTEKYPHEVFDRLLEEAGAQVNAATWLDWTFYYENLPAGQLDLAARLESDRMVHLVLTREQLDSEREVVRNERRFRVENDPDGAMDEALFESLFPTHPYGMPTIGYMADLDNLTLDRCLAFYRTYYSVGNATIVIVGDVTPRAALETVARHYAALPQVEVPRPVPEPEAEQKGIRTRDLKLPVATEKAKMAWRTVPAGHADVYSLEVVNEVMFATESSRVHRILIEDEQVASEVDGAAEPLAQDGIFLVDVVMNEGKPAAGAVDVAIEQLARLAADGPSADELNRAKNHAEAAFLRSLATVGSRATQLGSYELTAGDFKRMFRYVDGVRAVTAEDVRRVAGKYLTKARANVVFGRPNQ